MKSNMWHYHSQ